MAFPKNSFLFFCIFASFCLSASARFESITHLFCPYEDNTFPENSVYGANVNNLLSNLSSVIRTDHSGFYNLSYGQAPDKVEAIALCRGDVGQETCKSCIEEATEALISTCSNQIEPLVWEAECMLRYSNESIFNKLDTKSEHSTTFTLNKNVSNPSLFNQVVTDLLNGLKDQAVSGNSLLKFAIGSADVSDSEDVYALLQCTPDLTEAQCNECLSGAIDSFVGFCLGKQDCSVYTGSCVLRTELSLAASPPSPPPSNTATRKGQIGSIIQILATLATMIFVLQH